MTKFLLKIEDIFSHGAGVVAWCVCTIGGFLAGYEAMFGLLFFCVIVDASWGIYNAVRAGKFVLSDLMRQFLVKSSAKNYRNMNVDC